MLIASFDIGEKNFAYCVAKYTDANLDILQIAHHNVIIKKTQTVIESCIHVSTIIMKDAQLMACDRFLIEQQMRGNTRAQRLGQHVWSTLYTLFPERLVKFVPSHMKTQHFIGKNKLKDKERKTWSVVTVTQEGVMSDGVHHRQIIEEIKGMNKKDDVCDTILQVIAYVDREVRKDGTTGSRRCRYEQDEPQPIQYEGGAEAKSSKEV